MRQRRIRMLATALQIAVCAFGAFWFWEYGTRIYQHVFVADWASYGIVDDSFRMTAKMRILAVCYYLPVFFIAFACLWYSTRLLGSYMKGQVFHPRASHALMGLGVSLVAVALIDTFIGATEAMLLTWWNADGPMGLRYYYDAGDITIGMTGLGFFIIGYVTKEAYLIAQENEGFV